MLKIGFIDYFLDEWHSSNYPAMLDKLSNGEAKVTKAFGIVDRNTAANATDGLITNAEWSIKMNIPLASSIEEVVSDCDALIVLSPNNPEIHWEICQLPLRSGKRVYVDKTFAPTKKIAEDLFELAAKHGTPMFSSSANRFAKEIKDLAPGGFEFIASRGPGRFDNYLIHQVEPLIKLAGDDVRRVMYVGSGSVPGMIIEFKGGMVATTAQFSFDCKFNMVGRRVDGTELYVNDMTDGFDNFLTAMLAFFNGGDIPVAAKDTINVMTVLEAANKALAKPFDWVNI